MRSQGNRNTRVTQKTHRAAGRLCKKTNNVSRSSESLGAKRWEGQDNPQTRKQRPVQALPIKRQHEDYKRAICSLYKYSTKGSYPEYVKSSYKSIRRKRNE